MQRSGLPTGDCALERRWLPWLRDALAALDLSPDRAAQDHGVRLRRAARANRRPAGRDAVRDLGPCLA